jgi:phage shock protein PspC (stress-responsive transcriptional regulator)
MQRSEPNLFTRPDTFFGVCQGLGEDLRIHPNFFRLALAVLLYLDPVAAVASYVGAGLLVLVTRWLIPNPQTDTSEAVPVAEPATVDVEVAAASGEAAQERLPLAA